MEIDIYDKTLISMIKKCDPPLKPFEIEGVDENLCPVTYDHQKEKK